MFAPGLLFRIFHVQSIERDLMLQAAQEHRRDGTSGGARLLRLLINTEQYVAFRISGRQREDVFARIVRHGVECRYGATVQIAWQFGKL